MTGDRNNLPELPKGWVWTLLDDIGEVITGNTPSKKKSDNYGSYIPFVKPPELNNCVITSAEDNLSKEGAKLGRLLPPESVLVSCIGILGKTGLNKISVAFNQQINGIIFLKGVIPKYGFYYCQTLKNWLYSVASATTLPIVNKSKFALAPIPIPPLNEQQRIVAKIEELFTRLDAGVEALKKAKAQLKRYRQSVLKHAFEGKLTEEWRKTHKDEMEPASVLLERIKEERKKGKQPRDVIARSGVSQGPEQSEGDEAISEIASPSARNDNLPKLPEGWVWTFLPNLGELNRGKSKYRPRDDKKLFGGKYPFIQTGDVRNSNGLIKSYTQTYNEFGLKQSRLWPQNTLCITIAANIAETAILGISACFPDSIVGFIADERMCKVKFVCFFIKTIKDKLESYAPATAQKNINLGTLLNIVVPLPPLPEQHKIVEEIECRLSVAEEVEKTIKQGLKQAERLRQSILKRAFEGKLVPQDPCDEPAGVLLEKIKLRRQQTEQRTKTRRRKASG